MAEAARLFCRMALVSQPGCGLTEEPGPHGPKASTFFLHFPNALRNQRRTLVCGGPKLLMVFNTSVTGYVFGAAMLPPFYVVVDSETGRKISVTPSSGA